MRANALGWRDYAVAAVTAIGTDASQVALTATSVCACLGDQVARGAVGRPTGLGGTPPPGIVAGLRSPRGDR
jgi:hypothetical protein